MLRYWRNVRRLTIKLLDEFPADSFDYRPTAEVMTVSQIFRHILEVELYIRRGFIDGVWEKSGEPITNFFEKDMLRDKLRYEHKKTLDMFAAVPDGKFMAIINTPFGEITGEILIQVAIDEEIHHRGNLYTYLRCLGKTPPQMIQNYGEILKEK